MTVVGLPTAAILLFIVSIVGWFNAGIFDSGDGVYRRGAGEAAFQVRFSPVDLSRAGRYEYRFTRLGPKMNYVVGMTILNEHGKPIRTDTHGRADLLETEHPSAKVLIRLSNERVGPDGGWGTHFEPRYFGIHTLTIAVEQPSAATERRIVHPVIEGYVAWP